MCCCYEGQDPIVVPFSWEIEQAKDGNTKKKRLGREAVLRVGQESSIGRLNQKLLGFVFPL